MNVAPAVDATAPAAVDFDALHAALGVATSHDDASPANPADHLADSDGRTNATYASSRPHTIPPSYSPPSEERNVAPVIVATDDTLPSAPPHKMTVPLAESRPPPGHAGSTVPIGVPRSPSVIPSGPHGPAATNGAPSQRPLPRVGAMTMRMPERPINPRRARTPTLIVRPRGPSAKQKLVAFMAMLVLVTACGIAVIFWRKPQWIGLEPSVPFAVATNTVTTPAPPKLLPALSSSDALPLATSPSASASSAVALMPPAAPVRIVRPRPAPSTLASPAPAASSVPHPSPTLR